MGQKISTNQYEPVEFGVFIEPTFENGWQHYSTDPTGWEHAGYIKLASGLVVLKGLVKNGTAGETIFNLPVGYRPIGNTHHPVLAENEIHGVNVYNDGRVLHRGNKTGWFSLAGIVFRAEQ